MNQDFYIETLIKKNILFENDQVFGKSDEITKRIENFINNKYGNKCIEEGFLLKDSIKIITRSKGKIDGTTLGKLVSYQVEFKGKICMPADGDILKVKISNINNFGLQCNEYPLEIYIPINLHNNKTLFNQLKKGDTIDIIVCNANFKINTDKIIVIAKLKNDIKELPKKQNLINNKSVELQDSDNDEINDEDENKSDISSESEKELDEKKSTTDEESDDNPDENPVDDNVDDAADDDDDDYSD